jgi:hypothetical protein
MRFSKFGVTEHDRARATPGVTLFSPLRHKVTYLIGMQGEILHQWNLESKPGNYAYLLPNGNLLVAVETPVGPPGFNAKGGKIQELDWDGNIVWEYHDDYQHHDFHRCDNGNTIYLGWELLPEEHAARVQGGDFGRTAPEGIWGDYVREVNPNGETVWEWHFHENVEIEKYPNAPMAGRVEWSHPNSIMSTPDGDIMVSWRHNNLIAVIDKKTGKFKFEWQGTELGHQHDFQILENGNYMVFINQNPGPGAGSRVLEFDPKTKETVWDYQGKPRYTFHSPFISGAQRLWSGNTLICEGMWGRIFEVTPDKELVWEYVSPYFTPQNDPGPMAGNNNVFRAYRYAVDGPEIQGRVSLR